MHVETRTSTWPRSSGRTQTHAPPSSASSPNTLPIPRLPSAAQLSRWINPPGRRRHLYSPAAATRRRLQARPGQVNGLVCLFVCLLPPGSVDTVQSEVETMRRNTLLPVFYPSPTVQPSTIRWKLAALGFLHNTYSIVAAQRGHKLFRWS